MEKKYGEMDEKEKIAWRAKLDSFGSQDVASKNSALKEREEREKESIIDTELTEKRKMEEVIASMKPEEKSAWEKYLHDKEVEGEIWTGNPEEWLMGKRKDENVGA